MLKVASWVRIETGDKRMKLPCNHETDESLRAKRLWYCNLPPFGLWLASFNARKNDVEYRILFVSGASRANYFVPRASYRNIYSDMIRRP